MPLLLKFRLLLPSENGQNPSEQAIGGSTPTFALNAEETSTHSVAVAFLVVFPIHVGSGKEQPATQTPTVTAVQLAESVQRLSQVAEPDPVLNLQHRDRATRYTRVDTQCEMRDRRARDELVPELLARVASVEQVVDLEESYVILARRALIYRTTTKERIEDDRDGIGILGPGIRPVGAVGVDADWIDVVSDFLDDSVPFLGDAARAGKAFHRDVREDLIDELGGREDFSAGWHYVVLVFVRRVSSGAKR